MASVEVAHGYCTQALAARAPSGPREGEAPARWLLVALTAIGPVSFQIFLPSLPSIRDGFGVTEGVAQLALSLSMLGIAAATLAYGGLADRWGRRPTLILGMSLLLAGSVLCALAPSIHVLILGRIVQAAGGAAGMVVTRAVVLDLYGRERAGRVLAGLLSAMVVAPMLATPVGGVLNDALGWRANFATVAALGGLALLAVVLRLPETEPAGARAEGGGFLARSRRLLASRAFLGFALQGAFAMGAFTTFMTSAPYALGGEGGLSATGVGLAFVLVTGGFAAGSLLGGRLPEGAGNAARVRWGALAGLAAALLAAGLALAGVEGVAALVLPMTLYAAAVGVSMPAAQAGAIGAVEGLSGTASGLSGFLGTALGAAATQAVGGLSDGSALPVALGVSLMAALAFAASWLLRGVEAAQGW